MTGFFFSWPCGLATVQNVLAEPQSRSKHWCLAGDAVRALGVHLKHSEPDLCQFIIVATLESARAMRDMRVLRALTKARALKRKPLLLWPESRF